ncbi:MAG: DUF1326 domain-containing protein [Armatimonadota bacterium]
MKFSIFAATALTAVLASAAQAAPAVTGEYVEARSANVFVGACHHEGEILTAGRNAVLAWKMTGGEYQGVSMEGVNVVAVVAADKHLKFDDAKRRSVVYLSEAATPAQRQAAAALLKERAAGALGEVVDVRVAPVRFDSAKDMFTVAVDGRASMKIKKGTAELCCKQPYEVWGKPFIPVKAAKTGYCVNVEYRDGTLLKAWSATDQNNAFFGEFAL